MIMTINSTHTLLFFYSVHCTFSVLDKVSSVTCGMSVRFLYGHLFVFFYNTTDSHDIT
jgi:hypothetical protein